MFKTKLRTALALFAAVFTVAAAAGPIAPTDAQALIKSDPTGNSDLDKICKKIADLINYANSQGDLALIDGDDEGAQAWYSLADDMIRRGTKAGCKLRAGRYAEAGVRPDLPVSGGTQLPEGKPLGPEDAVGDGMPTVSDGDAQAPSGGPQLTYAVPTKALAESGKDRREVEVSAKRLFRHARVA